MRQVQIKGGPGEALFAATLGFFFGFAAVALFGPTAQELKGLMDLSPSQVGFLVAMPSLSGSLLRIPFGAWVDTTGGRKPFLVLMGISLMGMTGLAGIIYLLYPEQLQPGLLPLLLVLGLLCGSGIATFSVGISQVSYWYPQSRQGWALGVFAGAGNLAPGLFSFLLPVALASWGLTAAYIAWLIFLVIGTILYAALGQNAPYFQFLKNGVPQDEAVHLAKEAGQEIFPAGSVSETLKISAKVWKTWVLVGLYFTTFGGFIALTTWFPTYWQSYLGMSSVAAGMLTAVYSILTSGVRIVGGSFADRFGGENVAMLSLFTLLVGSAVMAASRSVGLSSVAATLMAVGMGATNAAVFKLVPQEVPEAVGGTSGWIGGLGAFGGFVIPPVMGLLAEAGGSSGQGYASGFWVFVGLALFSLGLAFLLKLKHTRSGRQVLGV